jgi:hypothetical protein
MLKRGIIPKKIAFRIMPAHCHDKVNVETYSKNLNV